MAPPPGSAYDVVVANYQYLVTEVSLRLPGEDFGRAAGSGNVSQSYPVTRNRTDYLGGTTPTLVPPTLDPLSASYYPVYEYYVASDGSLAFSTDLLAYGATPCWITVEYDTLARAPRLTIDLTRPADTSQTPTVNQYQIPGTDNVRTLCSPHSRTFTLWRPV